jgi:hypothetical protein
MDSVVFASDSIYLHKFFQKRIVIKVYLRSTAFPLAGFAILGEEAEVDCSRRLYAKLHPPRNAAAAAKPNTA